MRGRAEVRFIKGRTRFHGWRGTPTGSPKQPNLLAIYRATEVAGKRISMALKTTTVNRSQNATNQSKAAVNGLKSVSSLNKLPPPALSISDAVSATARKAEFDKLIKELKRLEPDITKGDKLKVQAVASITKYLDGRPRGDRDKNLTLIAGALGKNVRTLYRWISEAADPEGADKKLAERRAQSPRTNDPELTPVQLLNDVVFKYLSDTGDDVDGIFQVLKDNIPQERLCASLKKLKGVCP